MVPELRRNGVQRGCRAAVSQELVDGVGDERRIAAHPTFSGEGDERCVLRFAQTDLGSHGLIIGVIR